MSTHELEGKPLWKLTDKQVLEAMRGRGNELETARTLASLCRVFQKAAETNPACAPGLMSAIGLTQMYGQGMAPGHEDHPFKHVDKNLNVASIMAGTSQPVLDTYKPKLHRSGPKPTRVYANRVVDLDSHMEASRPGPVTTDELARPLGIDFETHSRQPLQVPATNPHDRFSVPREPRPPKPKTKTAIVGEVAMAIFAEMGAEGVLTARGLHAKCPAGILYQDVQNGLVALRKAGTVHKFGTHGFVKAANAA
jgi:hypothetical protein